MTTADAAGPNDRERGEATRLLRGAAGGAPGDAERLHELLRGELHALAAGAMRGERAEHTLQPTALVNEAWLRLFAGGDGPEDGEGDGGAGFQDRRHFLAVSARVMRRILVDHARGRRRLKRGGGWQRVELEAAEAPAEGRDGGGVDLVALDEALDELRALSPRQVEVVELRFFGGRSNAEVAEALDVSERTVEREWRFAKAWLSSRLAP